MSLLRAELRHKQHVIFMRAIFLWLRQRQDCLWFYLYFEQIQATAKNVIFAFIQAEPAQLVPPSSRLPADTLSFQSLRVTWRSFNSAGWRTRPSTRCPAPPWTKYKGRTFASWLLERVAGHLKEQGDREWIIDGARRSTGEQGDGGREIQSGWGNSLLSSS